MYPDSGYKTTHAQSVCTRPFSRGEGPGDEATNASPICLYREAIHLQCLLREWA